MVADGRLRSEIDFSRLESFVIVINSLGVASNRVAEAFHAGSYHLPI